MSNMEVQERCVDHVEGAINTLIMEIGKQHPTANALEWVSSGSKYPGDARLRGGFNPLTRTWNKVSSQLCSEGAKGRDRACSDTFQWDSVPKGPATNHPSPPTSAVPSGPKVMRATRPQSMYASAPTCSKRPASGDFSSRLGKRSSSHTNLTRPFQNLSVTRLRSEDVVGRSRSVSFEHKYAPAVHKPLYVSDVRPGMIIRGPIFEEEVHFDPPQTGFEISKHGFINAGAGRPWIICKYRFMIVVSKEEKSYTCVPIFTHNKKGLSGKPASQHHEFVSVKDWRWTAKPRLFKDGSLDPDWPSFPVQGVHEPLYAERMMPGSWLLSEMSVAWLAYPVTRKFEMVATKEGMLSRKSFERLLELLGDFGYRRWVDVPKHGWADIQDGESKKDRKLGAQACGAKEYDFSSGK